MAYEDQFRDPGTAQALQDFGDQIDPRKQMQFDPYQLYQLLRRKGVATQQAMDLNRNAAQSHSPGLYGVNEGFNVQEEGSGYQYDPTNEQESQYAYDMNDASPFRSSGFGQSQPQPYGGGDSDADRLAYRSAGPAARPSFAGPSQQDPYGMNDVGAMDNQMGPMAMHATRKQQMR